MWEDNKGQEDKKEKQELNPFSFIMQRVAVHSSFFSSIIGHQEIYDGVLLLDSQLSLQWEMFV